MTIDTRSQQAGARPPEQVFEQTVEKVMLLAVNHHQFGQLESAEDLYQSILKIQPDHPDANHNLGLLAVQTQRPAAALAYFEAALNARPEQDKYWLSYIDCLIQAGQPKVARTVLDLGRQHGLQGDAVANLALRLETLAQTMHSSDTAQSSAMQTPEPVAPPINQEPSRPKATRPSRPQKGKPSRQAVDRAPSVQEMNSLVALYGQGRTNEVEPLARLLTVRFPRHGFGWKLLGASLSAQGRTGEALLCMQESVRLTPDDAEAHSNLGRTLRDLGRQAEAEFSQRQALALNPNFVAALNSLGIILLDQGRHMEAEDFFLRALALDPDDAKTHNNLGITLQSQGRFTEAIQLLRRALAIKADDAVTYSTLLFCMSHDATVEPQQLYEENLAFGEQFEAPLRADWRAHGNLKDPDRCLQVGFVSGDLRNHAVASFVDPVLNRLSSCPQLALHAYSNHAVEDYKSQRIKGYMKHWHPVFGMSEADPEFGTGV